jgi:hypothetical protein
MDGDIYRTELDKLIKEITGHTETRDLTTTTSVVGQASSSSQIANKNNKIRKLTNIIKQLQKNKSASVKRAEAAESRATVRGAIIAAPRTALGAIIAAPRTALGAVSGATAAASGAISGAAARAVAASRAVASRLRPTRVTPAPGGGSRKKVRHTKNKTKKRSLS